MKKYGFCLIALMLFTSIGVFAQKNLGDYIEINGVPAFVFYLDQSKEHGLAMSIPALDAKGVKEVDKMVKKGLLSAEQGNILKNNLIGEYNSQGIAGKKSKDLFENLMGKLTDSGKSNQEQISAYCSEHGIQLAEVFPLQSWAKSLGEGWYIPGDQELIWFTEFYCGGLGKKNGMGAKFYNQAKKLSDNELIQNALMQIVHGGLFSSTAKNADGGFRKLRTEMIRMPMTLYFDLFDTAISNNMKVCAVHEF